MERVADTSSRVAIVSADQCTTNTAGAIRIREIKACRWGGAFPRSVCFAGTLDARPHDKNHQHSWPAQTKGEIDIFCIYLSEVRPAGASACIFPKRITALTR